MKLFLVLSNSLRSVFLQLPKHYCQQCLIVFYIIADNHVEQYHMPASCCLMESCNTTSVVPPFSFSLCPSSGFPLNPLGYIKYLSHACILDKRTSIFYIGNTIY